MSTSNPQLDELLEIFNEEGVKYWVDSGTLLGLVRDGELLESDEDIDVSAFVSEYDKIESIGEEIEYYRVHKRRYSGDVINIKFYPENEYDRMVDINLFKVIEDHLVCPARLDLQNPFSTYNPLRIVYGVPRHIIYSIFYGNQLLVPDLSSAICGNHITHEMAWWCIPKELVCDIRRTESFGAYTPNQVESYLEYRYGAWEQPDDNWDSDNDDGAIIPTLPENIN